MDDGSSSYSPPALFSLVSVPSSVIALQKFRATHDSKKWSPLEPPEPDYKAYVLVDSAKRSTTRASTQLRLNTTSVRVSFNKAFHTATRISPTAVVAVAPFLVLPPPPLSSSSDEPSSSLLLAAAPSDKNKSSSRLPLVVALVAYFHQSPLVVARSLVLNVSFPEFILCGGSQRRKTTVPTPVRTPGGKAPGQTPPLAAAFDSSSSEDEFMPQELGRSPLSGSSDEDLLLSSERQLLYYKKLRETGVAVVAELICRLVVVVGAGGDVLMFFESIEEQALDERALARVSEKRSSMMQRGFKVVSGRETGCLIMVRTIQTA